MNAEYDAASAFTNATLDELLNLDFLAGSSTGSRSASSSPKLPPTPPQLAPEPLFNFLLDDEYSKTDPYAVPPAATTVQYDFLGALNYASAATGSPDSAGTAVSPTGVFAIDPQLVGTPTPSKALSDIDEDEDHDDDDIDLEEKAFLEPIKVGGKGKNRKGTVQSGGIEKRPVSVPRSVIDKKSEEPDDWRPSPEEYKKMSSKEKRQLRNKISARNFRVRRKEYITTLEGDISDRDRMIDAIRSELGNTKAENAALREEIDALKRALLDGTGPELPPPGPLPLIPAAITATAQARTPAPQLITPNTKKDLPTSPRLGASTRGFWGGNTSSFANFTPVHTTLVPDFPPLASAATLAGKAPGAPAALQENLNPALNFHVDAHAAGLGAPAQAHAFDSFADVNPFTLKTLDAYRMQLWGKMASHQHAARAQQLQAALRRGASPDSDSTSPPSSPPLGGLAANLRPAFFHGAKTPGAASAVLAGKASASASAHGASPASAEAVAALASQTLLRRLGSAFWDAFSGASAPGPDADKVRRVLEGKAVVRVVDVDEPAQPAFRAAPAAVNLRPAPAPVQARAPPPPSPKLAPAQAKCMASSMTDLLEESMRTLSISKKSSV